MDHIVTLLKKLYSETHCSQSISLTLHCVIESLKKNGIKNDRHIMYNSPCIEHRCATHASFKFTDEALAAINKQLIADKLACKDLIKPFCYNCNHIRRYEFLLSQFKYTDYTDSSSQCPNCDRKLKYYNVSGDAKTAALYAKLNAEYLRASTVIIDKIKQGYNGAHCKHCDITSINNYNLLWNLQQQTEFIFFKDTKDACPSCPNCYYVEYSILATRFLTRHLISTNNDYTTPFCIKCNQVRFEEHCMLKSDPAYYNTTSAKCSTCKDNYLVTYTNAALTQLVKLLTTEQTTVTASATIAPLVNTATPANITLIILTKKQIKAAFNKINTIISWADLPDEAKDNLTNYANYIINCSLSAHLKTYGDLYGTSLYMQDAIIDAFVKHIRELI